MPKKNPRSARTASPARKRPARSKSPKTTRRSTPTKTKRTSTRKATRPATRRGTTSRKGRGTGTRSAKKKTRSVAPVPRGYHAVTPFLTVSDAAAALDFYQRAFGAKERSRDTMPDGKVMHAEMKIGDSIVMLSDEFPGGATRSPSNVGGTTQSVHLFSRNVDKLWEQAREAGAEVVMPLDNQFWGDRYGIVRDPYGHVWSLGQRIRMSAKEKREKRQAAEAMFRAANEPRQDPQQERELFA